MRKGGHASAYKVRECRDRLRYEGDVVASIARYLAAPPSYRRASTLVGCTSEDKAFRLKDVPPNIAHHLGANLIPAVEALHVEGIPKPDIHAFVLSIQPRVRQLIVDCNAIQAVTRRSIDGEYARLKAGRSDIPNVCAEALDIAEQAVLFCQHHRVL